MTNRDSFENVNTWFSDVKENAKFSQIPVYLIGNKIDLPNREISQDEAVEYCKSLGMKYFEISCKINMNVTEIINRMILDCYLIEREHGQKLKRKNTQNSAKSKCC